MAHSADDDYNEFIVGDFDSSHDQNGCETEQTEAREGFEMDLQAAQNEEDSITLHAPPIRMRRQPARTVPKTTRRSIPSTTTSRKKAGGSKRTPKNQRPVRQSAAAKRSYKEDDESNDSELENNDLQDYDHDKDISEHDNADEIKTESPKTRTSTAGHSLRSKKSLARPEHLKEYQDSSNIGTRRKQVRKQPLPATARKGAVKKNEEASKKKYTRLGRGLSCEHCHGKRIRCDAAKPKCSNCIKYNVGCLARAMRTPVSTEKSSTDLNFDDETCKPGNADIFGLRQKAFPQVTTQREDIRLSIEKTTEKRYAFLREYGHLMKPLLPTRNFITRLEEAEKSRLEKESKHNMVKGTLAEPNLMHEDGPPTIVKDDDGDVEMTSGAIESMEKSEPSAVPYTLLEAQPSL